MQKAQRAAELRLEPERRQGAAGLSLLKAQTNPHFFLNTLNNMYALTLLDSERVRAALHRLLRMMRCVRYETPASHTRQPHPPEPGNQLPARLHRADAPVPHQPGDGGV